MHYRLELYDSMGKFDWSMKKTLNFKHRLAIDIASPYALTSIYYFKSENYDLILKDSIYDEL